MLPYLILSLLYYRKQKLYWRSSINSSARGSGTWWKGQMKTMSFACTQTASTMCEKASCGVQLT